MLAMRLSAAFGQATAPRAAGLRSAVVRATRTPRLTTPENGVQELSARAGAPAFREPPGQRFARAEARRGHLADRRCVLCHQALRSFCTADHLVKQDQQDSVRGSSMFFTRKKSSAELPK